MQRDSLFPSGSAPKPDLEIRFRAQAGGNKDSAQIFTSANSEKHPPNYVGLDDSSSCWTDA